MPMYVLVSIEVWRQGSSSSETEGWKHLMKAVRRKHKAAWSLTEGRESKGETRVRTVKEHRHLLVCNLLQGLLVVQVEVELNSNSSSWQCLMELDNLANSPMYSWKYFTIIHQWRNGGFSGDFAPLDNLVNLWESQIRFLCGHVLDHRYWVVVCNVIGNRNGVD